MIEQRCDDDKRERVAEGEAMVARVRAKNLFSLVPYTVTVCNDMKIGLHIVEKCQGSLKVAPVSKQRHRFAEDIPCGAKRRTGGGSLDDKAARSCRVSIPGVKAGIEL